MKRALEKSMSLEKACARKGVHLKKHALEKVRVRKSLRSKKAYARKKCVFKKACARKSVRSKKRCKRTLPNWFFQRNINGWTLAPMGFICVPNGSGIFNQITKSGFVREKWTISKLRHRMHIFDLPIQNPKSITNLNTI